MFRFCIASALMLAMALPAAAQVHQVVPNDRENAAGTAGFLGPLSNAHRRYQLLIHESELTNLVGFPLSGITWRLLPAASADWPAADITFPDYEIYLSQSVAPADRSLTFDNNIAGPQTRVRAGPLAIPAGSFRAQGTPREFGMEITFDETYLYSGNHLLVELRHMGFSGTSSSVDAAGTATSGYGSLYSAAWASSTTATSGSQGNFAISQISAIPEPAVLSIFAGVSLLALRGRRRA